MFFETSAKTGYNVQNVFIEIAKLLYTQYKEQQNEVEKKKKMRKRKKIVKKKKRKKMI